MSRYLLRRLLIAVPSLLGISLVLFTVLALAPGDPFGELATNPDVPPEVRRRCAPSSASTIRSTLRYLHWLVAMLHGDWGFSFVSRINVDTLILQRLPATLLVIGSSQVLALLIALPVGVYAATRPYSIFDQIANTLAFIGFSLPTFFTGIAVHPGVQHQPRLAAVRLPHRHRRPPAGAGSGRSSGRRSCRSRCSACSRAPRWTRYVRSAVLDVIRLDYVTTARAKGLPESGVVIASTSCATR